MRSQLQGSFLMVLMLLTSCTSQSSTEQITHELQSVKSWVATTDMVADAWLHDSVPKVYAKQTLDKAKQELQSEIDKIDQIQPKTATTKSYKLEMINHIKHLANTVEQISTVVEQENKSAVTQQLKQLLAQEKSLDLINNSNKQ